MKKLTIWFCMAILSLAAACTQPAIAPTITPRSETESPRLVKPTWQDEWDKTLSAAKREGKLVVYTSDIPAARNLYTKVMSEKYGLETEFVVGTGTEMSQKLFSERRVGLYYGDISLVGAQNAVAEQLPEGVLDPLRPALLLPEVLDTKNWYGNKLPFWGGEHVIPLRGDPRRPIALNTSLVKPEEIVSYKDLLNPKFKGKIVMGDPTVTGATNVTVVGVAEYITGFDFFRELAKQQVFIIRNDRQVAEWLAHGKYAIVFGGRSDILSGFQKEGAPIIEIIPKEGCFIEAGARSIAVINKGPHPNAARIFVNWLLSKEGQTVFAESHGYQSLREDVSAMHLDAQLRRKSGDILPGEEFEKIREKHLPTIKEIFTPLMK